jgi:hypothetical protein
MRWRVCVTGLQGHWGHICAAKTSDQKHIEWFSAKSIVTLFGIYLGIHIRVVDSMATKDITNFTVEIVTKERITYNDARRLIILLWLMYLPYLDGWQAQACGNWDAPGYIDRCLGYQIPWR